MPASVPFPHGGASYVFKTVGIQHDADNKSHTNAKFLTELTPTAEDISAGYYYGVDVEMSTQGTMVGAPVFVAQRILNKFSGPHPAGIDSYIGLQIGLPSPLAGVISSYKAIDIFGLSGPSVAGNYDTSYGVFVGDIARHSAVNSYQVYLSNSNSSNHKGIFFETSISGSHGISWGPDVSISRSAPSKLFINNSTHVKGAYFDSSNNSGPSGYMLASVGTGGGTAWIPHTSSKSISVVSPTSGASITLFKTAVPIKVTSIVTVISGSPNPGCVFNVRYHSNRSSTASTSMVQASTTSVTTGDSFTPANSGPAANDWVFLTFNGVSGTGTLGEFHMTINFDDRPA
jgi:hypothetical protein